MLARTTVLVFGGTGLIGEPVVRSLAAAGAQVTVVSRASRSIPPNVTHLAAERRDARSLSAVLVGATYDVVIDTLAYDADDIELVAKVAGLRFRRYLAISTGQVYLVGRDGSPPFREEDAERTLMDEPAAGTRDHANWTYGVGKRRMEAALSALAESRGVEACALRLPIVIGAGDVTGRLWAYVERLLDGGPLLVPGDVQQPLRFVWSDDVARLVTSMLTDRGALPAALNWAQPEVVTFERFIEALAAELGVTAPPLVVCSPDELAARGLDANVSPYVSRWCSVLDSTLATRRYGIGATPFRAALRSVVRGLRERSPPSDVGFVQRGPELDYAGYLLGLAK